MNEAGEAGFCLLWRESCQARRWLHGKRAAASKAADD
jgi:hypothetical protein